MTIMKQLIESMITGYLEESYEDDLVESIFEEVSEETLEAIEEAILNELSPELLHRYRAKAYRSYSDLERKADRAKDWRPIQKKADDRKKHKARAEKKLDKQSDDYMYLPDADFEKKYKMKKSEWWEKYRYGKKTY